MAVKKKAKKRDEALAGIDDGCEPWLVEGARFDGFLEIPVIRRPERIAIPANMVPFSKRGSVDSPARYAVCCYELDRNFAPLLVATRWGRCRWDRRGELQLARAR